MKPIQTMIASLAMLAMSACGAVEVRPTTLPLFPGQKQERLVAQETSMYDGWMPKCERKLYTGMVDGQLRYIRYEEHCFIEGELVHHFREAADTSGNGRADVTCVPDRRDRPYIVRAGRGSICSSGDYQSMRWFERHERRHFRSY